MLAISVDGVGKVDELNESFDGPMPSLGYKVDSSSEDLVVDHSRGIAHVVVEERHDNVPQDLPIRDLQHQHRLIPGFREDRARAELLRSHLEEPSSIPVLIQKELRLDEVAEGGSWMSLHRDTHAAFSFNEAG